MRRGSPRFARRVLLRAGSGLTTLMVLVGLLLTAGTQPASAAVGLSVQPLFPSSVAVGQSAAPGSVTVGNTSSAPENTGTLTVNTVTLVPSCGVGANGSADCPAGSEDPGVFQLGPTGTGAAGTACAGRTFPITVIDPAQGKVSFGGTFVLQPPGFTTANPLSACTINFTFDVVKFPTKPVFSDLGPGTAQLAAATAVHPATGGTGSGNGGSFVLVNQAQPTLTTSASFGIMGGTITDTATLAGPSPPATPPTGTLTFSVYPSGLQCYPSSVLATTTTPVTSFGDFTSAPFAPPRPGSYDWTAVYSGDANFSPASGICADPTETSAVVPAKATVTTVATTPVAYGQDLMDVATLSGGFNPTGTLTFDVVQGGIGCDAGSQQSSVVSVNGNGTYTSPPLPTDPLVPAGKYDFMVTYSGDANNDPVMTCNEPIVVTKAPVTITTAAAYDGEVITDTATLNGAFSATGSVTFNLFGPNNTTCSATPVLSSTSPVVLGQTTISSALYTPTFPGRYRYVVSYSGDANNTAAVSGCNAPGETVLAGRTVPTLTTAASASVPLGGTTISDTAALAAGDVPTGTITFSVFGPADAVCGGTPLSTSTVPVSGNGTYSSGPIAPTAVGTYRFIASYKGDNNNTAVAGKCNDAGESVLVTPRPQISAAKSANPTSMLAPGGTFTFTATVANGGTDPVSVVSVTDSVYGNLADRAGSTCGSLLGSAVLAPGATVSCTFTGSFTGVAGQSETDVVTFTVRDLQSPTTATATAQTTVFLTGPVAPSTTRPATTTTTTRPVTPTTRRVTPTTRRTTPTTRRVTPATTVAPMTTLPPTTTTAPPTTTTLPPPPPPPAGPKLIAVSFADKPFGPAGSGVNVTVLDVPATCPTVYFYFDSTRIGAAPVHNGRASVGGLSSPGDAKPGRHLVTSSCSASGGPVLHSAVFRISPSSVHRTAFLTSLNQPRHLQLTLKSIGFSALLTGLLLLLLGFPSQLFNSTLQEHYEEVRGWFGLRRSLSEVVQDLNQRILFPMFLVAGGVLYAWLTPDFGLNLSTLALALGLAVAVAVTTVGFALPTVVYFGVRFRDRGRVLVMPGTILVGAAFVLISRLLHFQPGYLYGLLAVFVFHHEVDKRTGGRLAAVAAFSVMGLALLAWVTRIPVTGASMEPGVGFWTVVLESALSGAFVIGLESTLVGLLPMRFLDGSRIKEWSRTAWGLLFAFALFVLIEVLIQPGTGYVGHTSAVGKVAVFVLYLVFAGISVGFWAYFRYRRTRAESNLGVQGEYGVR